MNELFQISNIKVENNHLKWLEKGCEFFSLENQESAKFCFKKINDSRSMIHCDAVLYKNQED